MPSSWPRKTREEQGESFMQVKGDPRGWSILMELDEMELWNRRRALTEL